MLSINIIGAGKLGKTLGKLIVRYSAGVIQGVCNQTFESGMNAVNFIGQGNIFRKIADLPAADITLITTPDERIETCCRELVVNKHLKKGSIVAHCSGSVPSSVLDAARARGCFIASVHPMRSFAKPDLSFTHYAGTYCALEGDEVAVAALGEIFQKIGSVTYTVNPARKASYHAAGVFASNYLVTLFNAALQCLKDAEVAEDIAIKIILSLMQGTLNNLETTRSPEKSLTGPIKRGDIRTLEKHLQGLPTPILLKLYRTLGLATLDIANLPEDKHANLENIFSDY